MGFWYSECAKLLPEQSQPNDAEKLFALAVLGIIIGIVSWRKNMWYKWLSPTILR